MGLKQESDSLKPWNEILFESNNFCVMPCIGPLVMGHVMIVTKFHSTSLRLTDLPVRDEYNHLVATLREHPILRKYGLLEAEHGPSESDLGGACICHTHIQIIPTFIQARQLFTEPPLSLVVKDVATSDLMVPPYIFLRDHQGDERFLHVTRPNSQTVRKEMARLLGVSQWDWKIEPRIELIKETICFWRSLDINYVA